MDTQCAQRMLGWAQRYAVAGLEQEVPFELALEEAFADIMQGVIECAGAQRKLRTHFERYLGLEAGYLDAQKAKQTDLVSVEVRRPEQAVQCMATATDRGLTAQTIQMTRGKGAAHEALRGWGGAAGVGRA